MQLIVGIVWIFGIVGIVYLFSRILETHTKLSRIKGTVNGSVQQKEGDKPFSESLDRKMQQVKIVYDQAVATYNAQYDECVKQKISKEDAEAILKPLADKIKQIEGQATWEPVYRIGARIGDKLAKSVEKAIGDIGEI